MAEEIGKLRAKKAAKDAKEKERTQRVVDRFATWWKHVHHSSYSLTPAERGMLKNLALQHGRRSLDLIDAYFEMPDWYVKKQCHPVGLLLKSVPKLNKFIETGVFEE